MTGRLSARWRRDPAAWVLLLALLAQISMLFAVEYPPLQDYPNHLLRVHAIERLEEVPIYAEHLVIDPRYRPNLTMDLGLIALDQALPLPLAGKILVVLGLLLGYSGVWLYLNRFGRGEPSSNAYRVLAALIGAHLLGSWFYLKGFWNFTTACGLGLLYLVLVYPRDETFGWKRWLAASLAAFAVVTTHGFVFLAFSAIAGFSWLLRERGPSWRMIRHMSTVLPALTGFVLFITGNLSNSTLGSNTLLYKSGLESLLVWIPLQVWQRFDFRLDSLLGAAAWLMIAAGVVVLSKRAFQRQDPTDRTLVWMILVTVVLILTLPDALSEGWGHMKFRMAHIAVLVALPAVLALPHHRIRWGLAAAAALIWLVGTALSVQGFRTFDRQAREFMTMAENVPRGALLLTADVSEAQALRPFLHLWSHLCQLRDCLSPHIFATQYIQTLYLQNGPEVPPEGELMPDDWQAFAELASRQPYDGVLLSGRSAPGEAILDTVFERADENGSGILYLRPKASGEMTAIPSPAM